jgi:NitT/TauT family transport system permease protein
MLAALSTGFGFAWKSGVAAEIICTTGHSIGSQISAAKSTLDYAEVFASTVVVVVLSVTLEWLVRRIFRKREVVA